MTAVLGEIIDILVGGITGIAGGIGAGLSALVTDIFLTTPEGAGEPTLSVFGGVIVVFAGVSLAIGLSKFVVSWLTSLGARN